MSQDLYLTPMGNILLVVDLIPQHVHPAITPNHKHYTTNSMDQTTILTVCQQRLDLMQLLAMCLEV